MNIINIFCNNIENFYRLISIYRTIIIVNNMIDANTLYIKLSEKEHSIIIINNINLLNSIDFNNFDERIIIITYDLFYNLINRLLSLNLLQIINLIAFYNIDNSLKNTLTKYYYNLFNNNNYYYALII